MIKRKDTISMGAAAILAGCPLLLFTTPYQEFYVFAEFLKDCSFPWMTLFGLA